MLIQIPKYRCTYWSIYSALLKEYVKHTLADVCSTANARHKHSGSHLQLVCVIRNTIFTCELSESFRITDSNERQNESCVDLSESHETIRDSTALGRGSDVDHI
jgi:hypothetical protein